MFQTGDDSIFAQRLFRKVTQMYESKFLSFILYWRGGGCQPTEFAMERRYATATTVNQ